MITTGELISVGILVSTALTAVATAILAYYEYKRAHKHDKFINLK